MKRCIGLPLCLLLLSITTTCSASTSSSLLKHAVRNGRHVSTTAAARRAATKTVASRGVTTGSLRLLRQGRQAVGTATSSQATASLKKRAFAFRPTGSSAAALASTASATVTATARPSSFAGSTGFRQFSQRATRLQVQLQRSFSLRAIFSDVITNHPGTASTTTPEEQHKQWQSSLQDIPAVVNARPRLFGARDLQRLASGTLQESWSGFVGGYALATTTDITRRLYSKLISSILHPTTSAATSAATISQVLPYPSLLRFSQDTLQLHARSLQFGIEWAQMAAVFGASRLLVQTIRRRDDEWNTVVGSAVAGSVFACVPKRHIPPVAMARGALLYGGTMFLLHPTLWKEGMHKLMLTPPPSTTVQTATTNNKGQTTTQSSSLSATRFRNQSMEWWDGGI